MPPRHCRPIRQDACIGIRRLDFCELALTPQGVLFRTSADERSFYMGIHPFHAICTHNRFRLDNNRLVSIPRSPFTIPRALWGARRILRRRCGLGG